VRIKTEKGHQKLGVVKCKANAPNSYIVTCNGTDYRRNRRFILKTSEKSENERDYWLESYLHNYSERYNDSERYNEPRNEHHEGENNPPERPVEKPVTLRRS
jgi:hypothetical protein